MSLNNLQNYYKKFISKESSDNDMENAVNEARSEGHDDFEDEMSSGIKRANKILEAIKRKNSYKDTLEDKLEKATYPRNDLSALATWLVQQNYPSVAAGGFGYPDGKDGKPTEAEQYKQWYIERLQASGMSSSYGSIRTPDSKAPPPPKGEKKKASQKMLQKQFPPALASLMSAAAGWALSDDVVRSGGGDPRGQMSAQQAREWERELSAADRRKVERAMRSKMRRKSVDKTLDKSSFDALKEHYNDASDTYIKRSPEKGAVSVQKEHMMSPPRVGEMWDALKHRWVKPENVGHSVVEVQGKKRFRGVGTGAHERSVSGHGSGKTRAAEAGRRFKGQEDRGTVRPHQTKTGKPTAMRKPPGHAKHKKS